MESVYQTNSFLGQVSEALERALLLGSRNGRLPFVSGVQLGTSFWGGPRFAWFSKRKPHLA